MPAQYDKENIPFYIRRLPMIFLIECVVACLLFTAALEILAARRREVFVNDYPQLPQTGDT